MFVGDYFSGVIYVDSQVYFVLVIFFEYFYGVVVMGFYVFLMLFFYLVFFGVVFLWFFYMKCLDILVVIQCRFLVINMLFENKYYFDKINDFVLVGGLCFFGKVLWCGGDVVVIDGIIVNGFVKFVRWIVLVICLFQIGYVYYYVFIMIIGVFVLMILWINCVQCE